MNRVLMKAFFWAGDFDDEAAISVPDPSPPCSGQGLLTAEPFAHPNPIWIILCFLRACAGSIEVQFRKTLQNKMSLPADISNPCVRMSQWDSSNFQFYSRF